MADEQTQTPESTQTPENPAPSGVSLLDSMYPSQEAPVVEEPKPEGEGEGQEATGEGAEQGGEAQEVELSSLEELAEHFELDPEWLQTLSITQKVNGEAIPVKLADALATHRKVTAGDQYLTEAKTKAKSILEEANQQKEQLSGTLSTFAKLLESVESELERDTKGIDWAKLRESDPAEYAAKKAELKERRERLDQTKAEAAKAWQQVAAKAAQEQQEALKQRLPQEREVFLERVPEWADEEKAAAEREKVAQYLSGEGFSEDDIRVASFNGKVLAMAVKAMRYDAAKAKSETIKKKVVKIPKVLKPGPKTTETPKPNDAGRKDDPASILYPH